MDTRTRVPNSSDNSHEDGMKRSFSSKVQSFSPQQKIKNLWPKLQDICQILCRSIGLNILVSFFKSKWHPWGKGFEETTKIAVQKSQPKALLRALVHVVPVGVALWEITINWNTYYVGSYLLKQVYYQTAAKTHEIMIQASLAAIVFSYIRHEMVLGKGIPFGALFSGLQLNQISYLWSMEFCGSISSNHLSVWRKIIMLFFISFCFILAAVAGPSSAILLIPRLSDWPAGSTHIWVNATASDIWPTRMNGSSVSRHCAVVEPGSLSNECPSSEWNFMQTWTSLLKNSISVDLRKKSSLFAGVSEFPAIELTGKASARQYLAISQRNTIEGNTIHSSISSTQQAVIADALASTSTIWSITVDNEVIRTRHGASFHDDQKVVHTIANNYYQPYSSAFCLRDAIEGPNDQRFVAFPISSGFDYFNNLELLSNINASISGFPAVEAPALRRAQLLELSGMESENRVKWVQLSQSPLTGVSVGFIVLLPQNPPDSFKQTTTTIQNNTDIVVCGINAGWGASSINITFAAATNSVTSSLVNFDATFQMDYVSPSSSNRFQATADTPLYYYPPHYPSIPIEIDVKWAEYLNPYLPSTNTTIIDFLLKHAAQNGSKASSPEVVTQQILSGLITNGLARSGFTRELQGNVKLTKGKQNVVIFNGPSNTRLNEQLPDGNLLVTGKSDFFTVDPEISKDWVKLRVDSTIQGYAYNLEGPAPKVAIAFLLLYCCLALGHCFYSGISGISSNCWDSISEVTALAMNSMPTTILRNTCAGITEIRIFRTSVRILTKRDQEGEGEHLEVVFGDIEDEDAQKRAIKPNRKYGTMPATIKEAYAAEKIVKLD